MVHAVGNKSEAFNSLTNREHYVAIGRIITKQTR